MRTIEFRAVDELSDEFIYAPAFFVDSDNNQGYFAWGIDRHHCVKKETVQQFTGLFDRHNNKIFEGDIVRFKYLEELYKTVELTGVFYYNEDELRYEIEIFGNNEYTVLSYVPTGAMFDFEIIGNIHENPELLQVAEMKITRE